MRMVSAPLNQQNSRFRTDQSLIQNPKRTPLGSRKTAAAQGQREQVYEKGGLKKGPR
jgi:hypothetical protein